MTNNVPLPSVTLKKRRALPFYNRHPWVFAGAIANVQGEPEPGSEVRLLASDGTFIARGLFNPVSNIRVRLYSWDDSDLSDDLWSQRIDESIALRKRLFPGDWSKLACRLIYSEADGLSGLTVDWYGGWLMIQLTSRALSERMDVLLDLLKRKLTPNGIWLRTEKGMRESEGLELQDGLLDGDDPPRPLFVEENGVQFGVDVTSGQKTGFFSDQRDNRAAVAKYVEGHRVLDLFCYTGAFGITAAKAGAKEVVGVDVSQPALAMAESNAELNEVRNQMRFECSDAFKMLERLAEAGEKFDTVILDPPKMSRHRSGLKKALRGYHRLNTMALDVLQSDGLLVTCSCSGLVDRPLFEEMLSNVAVESNRRLQVLESRGQAADHPVSPQCLENAYLKCYILRCC
ncbi:MAG: pseudouridine synthase [Planctomycetaceae bacterium]|nr:pseudouridine synthase [Planctomycetaceae bacterium]